MKVRNTDRKAHHDRAPSSTASSRVRLAFSASWFFAVVLVASTGSAQAPTTVQLPTFHEFSVSTSVLVPDRGGMVLGGVSRSSQSSVSRGVPGANKIPGAGRLFGNRAIGRETGAATASVHAWIHNLDELDAETLAAARGGAESGTRSLDAALERKAAFLAKNVGRPAAAPTNTSVNKRR